MCMLCVVPPGVIPSREKLENSALNNPHGFGFAIAIPEEHRIIRERTMNADESVNRFLELRNQYLTGYAMWHARYATHGSRTVLNCHPFVVGDDDRTYLAHNGILDIEIEPKDDRSDTRVFAEDLLPAIGGVTALDNDHVWRMLEDFTAGSKVAILTLDPKAKHQMYLLNEKAGKEDTTGVWWSNDSCYLDYGFADPRKSKGNNYSTWVTQKDYDLFDSEEDGYVVECPNCMGIMDDKDMLDNDYSCLYCMYCFDCELDYGSCLCYTKYAPKNKTTKQPAITGWGHQEW